LIRLIARGELARLVHSILAWVLLAVHQSLLAWVFLRALERFSGLEAAHRVTGLTQELTIDLFGFAAGLALLTVPLLTMGLLAGEWQRGSYPLLLGAPVSLSHILLGKLLGACGLLAALAALPLLMCLLLWPWVALDLGLLLAAALGLGLAYLLFTAAGLWTSALSGRPSTAAAGAYGVLLLLSLVDVAARADTPGGLLLHWLAWNEHLMPFLMGLVQTSDVAYFLILTGLFLSLALWQLERRRGA
jgi:ABC-2 type transport system permease protein